MLKEEIIQESYSPWSSLVIVDNWFGKWILTNRNEIRR
jgi:hypothetical protein